MVRHFHCVIMSGNFHQSIQIMAAWGGGVFLLPEGVCLKTGWLIVYDLYEKDLDTRVSLQGTHSDITLVVLRGIGNSVS